MASRIRKRNTKNTKSTKCWYSDFNSFVFFVYFVFHCLNRSRLISIINDYSPQPRFFSLDPDHAQRTKMLARQNGAGKFFHSRPGQTAEANDVLERGAELSGAEFHARRDEIGRAHV